MHVFTIKQNCSEKHTGDNKASDLYACIWLHLPFKVVLQDAYHREMFPSLFSGVCWSFVFNLFIHWKSCISYFLTA